MEAVPVDGRTALAWAATAGLKSNKLAIINQARMTHGLPPFRIERSVFGSADAPIEKLPSQWETQVERAEAIPPEPYTPSYTPPPLIEAKPMTQTERYKMTSSDLRSMLFQEMRDLREGRSDPRRAQAMSALANTIVNTIRAEMEFISKIGREPLVPMQLTDDTQPRL